MNAQTRSLQEKEWIKIRKGLWILPLLLAYAAGDALLTLKNIDRVHGAFGLWGTLLSKQPTFFKGYLLLGACGAVLGFLQAWPECQGKRLRLMFQMPVEPRRILTVMLGTGLTLLLALNLAALGALAATMAAFHLPTDLIRPVLLSVLPWSLLSAATYLGTVAFFGSRGLPMKLLVLACALALGSQLAEPAGYGAFAPSLWAYLLPVLLLLPLTYYAYLRFLGDPAQGRLFQAVRAASLLLGALALCATLPGLLRRVALPARSRQGLQYSPVHGQWALSTASPNPDAGPMGASGTRYSLESGRELNRMQYAEALPILYAEDLIKWKRFPATIAGTPMEAQAAKYGWEYHQFVPRDWNCPPPMLHLMLEANPKGARLEMPTDLFRVRADGQALEFLRPRDGQVLAPKSERFTAALRDQGFRFPVAAIGGNPDVRKEFDFGYLLTDQGGNLFRLRMVDGAPVCDRGPQPVPGHVRALIVAENRRREFAGFIVTDTAFFTVFQQTMAVRPLPLAAFHADTTRVALWADPLIKSAVVQDVADATGGATGLAMTPDLTPGRSFVQTLLPQERKALERFSLLNSVLFPIQVENAAPGSAYVRLRVRLADRPAVAFLGSLALTGLFVLVRRARRRTVPAGDGLLVAAFGPVALLVLCLAEWRASFRFLNDF